MPKKAKNHKPAQASKKSKLKAKPKNSRSRASKSVQSKTRRRRPRKKSSKNKRSLFFKFIILLSIALTAYLFYLNQKITDRFEGRLWQLPAHVYARPLELFVGKSISSEQVLYELEYLNYQKVDGLPEKTAQYRHWKNNFEIKTRRFVFWDGEEQSHNIRFSIQNNEISQLTDLYSNTRKDLVRFDAGYLTGIFPSHSEDRVLVKLADVPDMLIKMLLLIEDRRFFSHWGVDPRSIARALIANLYSGKTVQGGSTLTQQLVKNLFLTRDKTITRKINEAFMSLLLEFHYDKKLILETYLNEIYLGQDGKRSIHGFGLASQFYFGKPLKSLSLDEMAILVGMVKAASYYNPKRNPQHARERRNLVLATMLGEDLITRRQFDKLSDKTVHTVKHARSGLYPAFIDMVKLQLQQDYQAEDLRSEGIRVFTTLSPYAQFKAEQAVVKTLPQLSKDKTLQSAVVVVSPSNGDVLAIVGDRKPSYKGFNRALNAQRQIGSLIKPVIYLTALQDPSRYTLATMLDDTEFSYKIKNQNDWRPQNYDKKYHGQVTLYQALLKSYNIPAARIGLDVGLAEIMDTLSALGDTEQSSKINSLYPSLTLGAINMSPVQVASIYQSFSANGFHSQLRSVHAVLDKNQRPLERYSLHVDNQVDASAMAIVNSALIDVTRYGTARRLSEQLDIQVAGKTGTSDDLRDSWFAGFSGDMLAVVWVGYDDNHPTTLTGSSGAMKIWSKLFSSVAYKSFEVEQTPDLVKYQIDGNNGLLTENGCENTLELLFIEGSQPEQFSDCDGGSGSNWFLNLFN